MLSSMRGCGCSSANYERVRDGGVSPSKFTGAALDEASVLRSFGSKTYQTFREIFRDVRYRWVLTATPSPNRFKELIHYADFLGVMDSGEALTRFFKRDSTKANQLTLYPHMEKQFWLWVSSWAAFVQRPSDLGYDDTGYDLPELKVEWHCVPVDHRKAWSQTDSWGQAQLFADQSSGLADVAEVKRDTMDRRVEQAKVIMEEVGPNSDGSPRHWILWHDLEAERRLIEKEIPGAVTVYGSMDLERREDRIVGFANGEFPLLATKPVIAGCGCNFQRHCADAIFLGSTYKFNDFIQAVHRIYRFQQSRKVTVHVIFSESEAPVIEVLKEKWAQHRELVERMAEIVRRNKLNSNMAMKLEREMGCDRAEVTGDHFQMVRNDCVMELGDTRRWKDDSVDLIVTSIPFGNQYEYSPSYNDFGHNPDNDAFFEQFRFLAPELLRVLKPGRVAAIHVKDRIRFGNVTGLGMPTVDRFSDKTCDVMEEAGFVFFGRITVETDVVRENNQTYRLGWSEMVKDGTKMGCGMNEYVLLLRKLPSDLSDAYADEPVSRSKEDYTRAQWQIDASGLWRSKGDRLPDPDLLVNWPLDRVKSMWREWCLEHAYDYKEHVEIGLELEKRGKLPASFMLFPPVSRDPNVWTDIIRMRVLNSEQGKRNEENHVCPLQLDLVERLIDRFSNAGELVMDPFGGIGTVPYVAVKSGREGAGIELAEEYWRCAVGYCEQADAERELPTLFDLTAMETEEAQSA